MLFNSLAFFVFFVVVYTLYLLLNHRWQNRLLILSSCFFYSFWNWKFLAVLFASVSVDFWCARGMSQTSDARRRKYLLILSIAVNLLILGFFKYFNFFVSDALAVLRAFHLVDPGLSLGLKLILPLGISFYTFEAISYVVDVYNRKIEPANNYWDYVLFVIYFPHLIAGPIMRAKSFLPQITTPRKVSWDGFYEGGFLFFWGIFEKVFVADNLAKIVNPVFAAGPYEGGDVLIALYAFAFQIFCDFDGYSNMARGLGKAMGFDITINFNLPYFAAQVSEFWHRWHISLSTWLRDYVYIPLGGSRQNFQRTLRNLFLTMLIGGFWHGASWTFVVWGGYHGLLLTIERIKQQMGWKIALPKVFKILIVFHLMVLGWLFFRSSSLLQAQSMFHALVFSFHVNGIFCFKFFSMALILLPLLLVQFLQYYRNDLMIIYRLHWVLKIFIYAVMAYLVLGWGIMKSEEFIYFQF